MSMHDQRAARDYRYKQRARTHNHKCRVFDGVIIAFAVLIGVYAIVLTLITL